MSLHVNITVNLTVNLTVKVATSALLFYMGCVSVTITLIVNSSLSGEEHDFLVPVVESLHA